MSSALDAQNVLAELEGSNRLLVQQVFKPIANEYRISVPAPGGSEEGQPLLYVKQKKMKIKEDIRFRLSLDDDQHLFMIKSKSVFEFRGRHEVLDAEGATIGMLEKDFRRSLLRSHWHVRDATGEELLRRTRRVGSWRCCDGLRIRSRSVFPVGVAAVQLRAPTRRPPGRVFQARAREVSRPLRARARAGARDVDRRLVVAFAVGLDALQDR